MQQTLDPALEAVTTAKCNFERFSARVLHLFSFVPDEKLTWTPSPTAKSSLRIVAHCGMATRFFADIITGAIPEPMPSPEEFFAGLCAAELEITTRESAVALLRETTAELCKAIDSVNADTIASTPSSPFGLMPMTFWLAQGSEHMADHAGQLEYLQTIWGDLDNHFAM